MTEIKQLPSGPDPDCPNCDGTGGALPGGACGVCWNWQGDEHWEYHVMRFPGWGAVALDGPFTWMEYTEWATDEFERSLKWPWQITYLMTTADGERIFRVSDSQGAMMIISVFLDEGILHHENQSHLPEYQKYLQPEASHASS